MLSRKNFTDMMELYKPLIMFMSFHGQNISRDQTVTYFESESDGSADPIRKEYFQKCLPSSSYNEPRLLVLFLLGCESSAIAHPFKNVALVIVSTSHKIFDWACQYLSERLIQYLLIGKKCIYEAVKSAYDDL